VKVLRARKEEGTLSESYDGERIPSSNEVKKGKPGQENVGVDFSLGNRRLMMRQSNGKN